MHKQIRQIGIGNISVNQTMRRYVNKTLETSRLTYGDFTRKFENKIARLHGRKHAIFCSSGTGALHVATQVLKDKYDWENGDEILVPSITFVATANVVLHNNLKPVFVDVEEDYFGIDPKEIEKHISKITRAIMPVHLFGQSCDMDPIVKIAKKNKLKIVEDSCETMFVQYHKKPVGSMGNISCFSTYATH